MIQSPSFKKFVADLNIRERQWLESHPETISKSIDEVIAEAEKPPMANTIAKIEESRTNPGDWNLYVDGKLIEIFFPPNAQLRATSRLGEILRERK